jgi:hypothetical protein
MDAELKHEQMDANLTASVKLLKHTSHQVSDFRVAQLLHKKFSHCIYIEIETATTSGLWQFGITIEPKKKAPETRKFKMGRQCHFFCGHVCCSVGTWIPVAIV